MTDNPKKSERVLSIDILRGFTLIAMVVGHFLIFWGNESAADTWIYFFLDDVLGDWGAAGFLMMMGMSQVLSANRIKEPDNRLLLKRALLRGGYLFVVGLIMLLLAFGPNYLWRWDVLTLMGTATVLLYFCRFLPSWLLLILAGALAAMAPLLRGMPFMATEWGDGFQKTPFFISRYLPGMFVDPVQENVIPWQLGKIVKGFFLSGDFPIFPWLMFSVLGFVLGRRIVQGRFKDDLTYIFPIATLLLLSAFGGAYAGSLNQPSSIVDGFLCAYCFYPDSFTMIIHQTGMILIIFSILFYLFDIRKKDKKSIGKVARVLIRTSNYSLSFYFLHYMLIGWPLALVYAFTGRHLIGDFMGAIPALICSFGAILALELLLIYWTRTNSKINLESFLSVLTARVVK